MLCRMISTCTSDISLILDQGRHYLVTQVHVYNLYRELGNLKYARDEWKFFSEYEDPVRVKTGRDWKSPVCVTPEAQVPLTLESKFRMTPIKS